MTKTMNVTGKAKLSVSPDLVTIMIRQNEKDPSYEGAVKKALGSKAILSKAIEAAGFVSKDLKTVHFGVNPVKENYQDENGIWKSVLSGYEYIHQMKLSFGLNHTKLANVLSQLSAVETHPEFEVSYGLVDEEAIKNQLIAKAMMDAKNKALILANAAEIKLGDILNIQYAFNFADLSVTPLMLKGMDTMRVANFDLVADDIVIEDQVTISWEIL